MTFTNNYRPTRTRPAAEVQDCQRLSGGFCPRPFFTGFTRWTRPAEKTCLRMASGENRESATSGPINFLRKYAHTGNSHRSHTSKTALRSVTLKRGDAEESANIVEIKCPANTVLLRADEGA
jgi:hypothetical protein